MKFSAAGVKRSSGVEESKMMAQGHGSLDFSRARNDMVKLVDIDQELVARYEIGS